MPRALQDVMAGCGEGQLYTGQISFVVVVQVLSFPPFLWFPFDFLQKKNQNHPHPLTCCKFQTMRY